VCPDTNSSKSSADSDSPIKSPDITHSNFESSSDSDYEPVAGPSNPLPRTY
ncbi:10538_t:CDS:1, partial [Paraglomus occultum]